MDLLYLLLQYSANECKLIQILEKEIVQDWNGGRTNFYVDKICYFNYLHVFHGIDLSKLKKRFFIRAENNDNGSHE